MRIRTISTINSSVTDVSASAAHRQPSIIQEILNYVCYNVMGYILRNISSESKLIRRILPLPLSPEAVLFSLLRIIPGRLSVLLLRLRPDYAWCTSRQKTSCPNYRRRR